ncbi:uncharacterized protein MONBRDRAFT_13139 [Monosiga brevicollis MX1]|uniref:Uncharacterized protein n=1 Tax=Monosiga brevicollis TaxID=81824 RepID=A9VEE4_MONBE|nr:uncharacterized protein MONBRDRAFT_13139 [Monosiga brevicollis MX1]EDQ84097.1 predicted protein [Monosiga brevicollis MX1]|eukprot:XP_001751091.1 hypothetical protein [Monosiga brevicollis MX1]
MGPAEDVAADVEIVKARAESAGLHLQPSKSRFYMPRHHSASITAIKSVLPDAVRETANTGMTVLGTPIGRREWMKKQLNDKAKHIAGKLNDMLTTGVSLQALLTAMQYVPSLINHLYTLPPSLTSGLSELLNRACKDTFVKAFFAKVNLSAPAGAEGHDVTLEQLLEARLFTRANTGGFGLHDLVERGPVAYVCNMAKLATRYPRVYDRLLKDASRAADFEVHVQRAGFQMATVKDAATQRPAEIIAFRSKAALDDLMAKCALDLQQAYLASREWGVSTVLTMRGRDKLRRLSDTTFAIAVVSMMDPSDTQQTHSDPSPPSASPPATTILPAAISHPVEHSEHANSAPLGEVSESETHNTAGEHSESEQDVLLSDPAPPIAANVLDAQRKVLLKTSGHRQLLACPFGLCKCKGPRLDRKAWINHVLREHPYDEQATDLVKQVMEAKLVTQCNKCHLFFEAAGISQHRSRCGANLKRATEALFHAAGHDLLEIMRGAWPQQCVGSRVSVCELLKLARHPLMQRSRYPSNATETKLMAATLSQLYWSAVHSDYTAEEREMCWALILALPSMLLSAPSTALSTIDLRNMFHDRLRWLVTGQLGRVADAMRKAVARKQSRRGQLNAGAGAHPNDAVDQSLRSLVRDPDLADEAWANHVTNRLNRGQIAKAFDADKARAVIVILMSGLHSFAFSSEVQTPNLLFNVKPTDKCPLCSSKTSQPRLTREHLLTCRPIKRHNALRDEMGRLLRYATLSHVWVEKSGYNANGQSCRIDLHCRNPFPGGALGPALPDLGIDVTVRTAQPSTTSQACIKVGAALRRAEKEKRDYYTGFNHGKTLIVPAAMTTTGGFASSFVDLLGQLARCAEARGVYQPGLDEAFVPRWKGRFAALVHQMNADHIQRHFGGVCLRSS